jgi:small nuclear ribonucleoprotein (snRNP)-like protein
MKNDPLNRDFNSLKAALEGKQPVKQQQKQPRELLPSWTGRQVQLKMRDGTLITGLLQSVSNYEALIQTNEGHALVMKHAIDEIKEVGGE